MAYPTVPEFIEDLPDEQAQPWITHDQGPFVAIIQRDCAGEDTHWVLVRKDEIRQLIEQLRAFGE